MADERTASHALSALVASRARAEGRTDSLHPGVCFYRVSSPAIFRKTRVYGLTMIVPTQGKKIARFGDDKLVYDPNNYLVLTGEAQFDGSVVEATPDEPYLAVSLDIPAEVVANTLVALTDGASGLEPEVDVVPAFVSRLDEPIAGALARLLEAIDDPLEREVVAPLVVQEIVFRLLRSEAAAVVRSAVGRGRNASSIERAMHYMRANASKPLSVEAVARHVAMSPSHFAHRFRVIARVPPMRYLKQVRLHDARALMLAGGVSVSEAAARVGYESASHFTRDFKGYFGAAPTEYVRGFVRIAGSGK